MLMDAMIKIPRIEDYLAKLSLQMKEFSLTGIQEQLKEVELMKADKNQIVEINGRLEHLESAITLIGAGPLPSINSGGDVPKDVMQQIQLLMKKIFELETELKKQSNKNMTTVNISDPEDLRE